MLLVQESQKSFFHSALLILGTTLLLASPKSTQNKDQFFYFSSEIQQIRHKLQQKFKVSKRVIKPLDWRRVKEVPRLIVKRKRVVKKSKSKVEKNIYFKMAPKKNLGPNNSDRFKLYAIHVDVKKDLDLDSHLAGWMKAHQTKMKLIAKIEPQKEVEKTDEVKVAQSAPVREKQMIVKDGLSKILESTIAEAPTPKLDKVSTQSEDDFVFIDFSKKKASKKEELLMAPNVAQVAKAPLSPQVAKAIQREMKTEVVPPKQPSIQKKAASSPQVPTQNLKPQDYIAMNTQAMSKLAEDEKSKLTIQLRHLELGAGFGKFESGFLVRPFSDDQDFSDYGQGTVEIPYPGVDSTMNVSLRKYGDYPEMYFTLALKDEDKNVVIPLFDPESLDNFYKKNKLNGDGGNVLVDLHEDIVDIDFHEAEAEKRFLLDEKFESVDQISNARYVLFANTDVGNFLMSYKLIDGQVAEKIIFVRKEGIAFERPDFLDQSTYKFSVIGLNLLGKDRLASTFSSKDIKYFNRAENAVSIGLNRFELKLPVRVDGFRNYFEFSHLGHPIILGVGQHEKFEAPGQDFISYILENKFQISELNKRCLIQFNLINQPGLVADSIRGTTDQSEMHIEVLYQDDDGKFFDEPGQTTKKIFVLGDYQGVVDLRLDFVDGNSQYLQTYCSENSYLVEHL